MGKATPSGVEASTIIAREVLPSISIVSRVTRTFPLFVYSSEVGVVC